MAIWCIPVLLTTFLMLLQNSPVNMTTYVYKACFLLHTDCILFSTVLYICLVVYLLSVCTVPCLALAFVLHTLCLHKFAHMHLMWYIKFSFLVLGSVLSYVTLCLYVLEDHCFIWCTASAIYGRNYNKSFLTWLDNKELF